MKLLIIIVSHRFDRLWYNNIQQLKKYMRINDIEIDYCGISNQDDFHVYEPIIHFKYKIINTKKQLSKICDFITDYKSQLNYDWYMKTRPDVKLLDTILIDSLSKDAINARDRVYHGPRKIKYGISVNGGGFWKNIGDCHYSDSEHDIILDDQIYIFHNNVVQKNAFEKIPISYNLENEYVHREIFNQRNIQFNVIGINSYFTRFRSISGDINM